MRIIQVLHSKGYGGAEMHALNLMIGLRSRGHEVLYVGRCDSWLAKECLRHEIPFRHIRMVGMLDIASYIKLRRLAKQWKADIVHGHLVRGSQYASFAVRGTQMIALSTAHATNASKHMQGCRHIIAVSNAVKKNLLAHNYPDSAITVVYNGVPDPVHTQTRDELRQELGIPADQQAMICIGRFVRDKGQDVLVSAVKQCPENIHVYFVGDPNTTFGQGVVSQACPRSHFLGYRRDVQRILPAFDACVLPSRREAISLALAEAAAAGLPMVGSNVGGVPEILLNEETGFLVPSEDARAMAESMTRLANDTLLARQMGQRARIWYKQRFTLEAMVRNTIRVYGDALFPQVHATRIPYRLLIVFLLAIGYYVFS